MCHFFLNLLDKKVEKHVPMTRVMRRNKGDFKLEALCKAHCTVCKALCKAMQVWTTNEIPVQLPPIFSRNVTASIWSLQQIKLKFKHPSQVKFAETKWYQFWSKPAGQLKCCEAQPQNVNTCFCPETEFGFVISWLWLFCEGLLVNSGN